MHKTGRQGFTLIELLVVISIISLLIALLMPALSSARHAGRKIQCGSNMKQIAAALQTYASENNSYVPREGDQSIANDPPFNGPRFSKANWALVFRRYVDSKYRNNGYNPPRELWDEFKPVLVYKCPSHPNKKHQIQYVNNGLDFASPSRVREDRDGRIATMVEHIRNPSGMVYLSDFTDDANNAFANMLYGVNQSDRYIASWYDVWRAVHVTGQDGNTSVGRRVDRLRHQTGSNVMYVDGHVEFRQDEYIYELKSWDDGLYNLQRN